jgi:hypothetical protein
MLRGDVAGRAGGTTARIGRFDAFLEIILANAKAALKEKVDALVGQVAECCRASIRTLASRTFNLKARSGRIVVDAKAVADAVTGSILDVAARPMVDGALVAASVKACTAWTENCGDARKKLEKDLCRVRKVLALELFQREAEERPARLKAEAIRKAKAEEETEATRKAKAEEKERNTIHWDAVESVVGKEAADQMKQGEGSTGTLYLQQKSITDEGCRTIAPALRTMPNLTYLSLYSNNIGDEGCRTIAPALRTMSNLKTLDLNSNVIGDNSIAVLSSVLPDMPSLDGLGLSSNKIGNVGCRCLLELVANGSLQSLTCLNLSECNISSELKDKMKRVWREKGKATDKLYLINFFNS